MPGATLDFFPGSRLSCCWGDIMAVGKPDITNRVVAHFPGFELLDTRQHHARYRHAAASSSAAFGFAESVSDLSFTGPAPSFHVMADGSGWRTDSAIFLIEHYELIANLQSDPAPVRILQGYQAAWHLIRDGAFARYLRSSWRYALFFLFPFLALPFLVMTFIIFAGLPFVAGLPGWHLFWSLLAAVVAAKYALFPVAKRLHLSNLFDQWRLALRLAVMKKAELNRMVDTHAKALRTVLAIEADDRAVTAHSLGGVFAILALGRILEAEPDFMKGKLVTLVTLAGSGLQVSLIGQAHLLRSATRRVLECPEIYWLDYQCLADPVHLYGSNVARDLSRIDPAFSNIGTPPVVTIRVKDMLHRSHYRRIRWDKLRLHRQFVLGSDRPYRYDFISLTAGPYASASFAAWNLRNGPAPDAVLSAFTQSNPGAELVQVTQ